jgi:hypothetical protein
MEISEKRNAILPVVLVLGRGPFWTNKEELKEKKPGP